MIAPETHNLRVVLSGRGLRRLLGVRLCSQFADGVFQAALGGSVLFNPDKQTTPLAVATATAIVLLPYSLIGPYVGVFLDRWSRRQVLVWTTWLRVLLVAPAALLTWAGHQGVLFIASVLLVIGLNRFFLSAVSAGLPHVVEDSRLVTANALSGTLGSISYSAGLASAIVLLKTAFSAGFHGYALVIALAPVGYVCAALLARRSFTVAELGPDAPGNAGSVSSRMLHITAGMVAGIRHLGARRTAAYAVAAQTAFRLFYGPLALITLLLYRRYFIADSDNVGASISGLAFVFAAGGAGVLLGAAVTPAVTRRVGGRRWVGAMLVITCLAVLAGGLPFRPEALVAAVFVVNVSAQGIKIVVDTTLQHECADDFRGRVFSVNDTAFNVTYVVGMVAAALTAAENGHSPAAVVVVAGGYALTAAAYLAATRRTAGHEPPALPEGASAPGSEAGVARHTGGEGTVPPLAERRRER